MTYAFRRWAGELDSAYNTENLSWHTQQLLLTFELNPFTEIQKHCQSNYLRTKHIFVTSSFISAIISQVPKLGMPTHRFRLRNRSARLFLLAISLALCALCLLIILSTSSPPSSSNSVPEGDNYERDLLRRKQERGQPGMIPRTIRSPGKLSRKTIRGRKARPARNVREGVRVRG